jgi:hypothetical protein
MSGALFLRPFSSPTTTTTGEFVAIGARVEAMYNGALARKLAATQSVALMAAAKTAAREALLAAHSIAHFIRGQAEEQARQAAEEKARQADSIAQNGPAGGDLVPWFTGTGRASRLAT